MRWLQLGGAVLCVLAGGGCERQDAARFSASGPAAPGATRHAVEIVQPGGVGLLDVDARDASGQRSGVACATCHEAGAEKALAQRDGHPEAMHRELTVEHGSLGCPSCHDGEQPFRLVLASGERLPIADYMRLCAQCHGPQFRDYEHGSHGGMKGYWDLRRGPRVRNGCIACHAAHAPAYPQVLPAAPPRDRFLEPKNEPGSAFEHRWPVGDP